MGARLGVSFPNALPLSEARRDPRRSRLYRTLVRSPLVAPEALGQYETYRSILYPYPKPYPYPKTSPTAVPQHALPVLTRPTTTAAELFPKNLSRSGGGINVGFPGVDVRIEETTEQSVRRWLEEETFWEGVPNKWFLLGGVVWWLKGRK